MFKRLKWLSLAVCALGGSAPAVADQPSTAACPSLQPGEGLGDRFAVGTVLKEESAVEPAGIAGWFHPTDPAGETAWLRFDDAKTLVEFTLPLPACVTLGDAKIETPSVHALAVALGTCGPEAVNEGGNVIECGGVSLQTSLDGATVRVGPSPSAANACGGYVIGHGWVDAAGRHATKGDRLAIEDSPVCLPGATAPVGVETTLAGFEAMVGPCAKTALRGGTHLACSGLTWSFAGPTLALSSLTVGPVP